MRGWCTALFLLCTCSGGGGSEAPCDSQTESVTGCITATGGCRCMLEVRDCEGALVEVVQCPPGSSWQDSLCDGVEVLCE